MRCTFNPSRKIIGLLLMVVLTVNCFSFADVSAAQTKSLDASFEIACVLQNDFAISCKCKINTPGNFSNVRLKSQFQKYAPGSSSPTVKETVLTDYTYDSSTGEYVFVFRGISAAEMGNYLQGTLLADMGGQTYSCDTMPISLADYAYYLLSLHEQSTAENDKKLCTLLVDMLNYGAAAQKYFNVNSGNPVNKNLTSSQKALATKRVDNPVSCLKTASLANAEASVQSLSLLLGNSTDLAALVSFNGSISQKTTAELSYTGIDGKSCVCTVAAEKFIEQQDGTYRIEFTGIPAYHFRTPLSIVIKEGSRTISGTTTYSYESYANAIVSGNYSSTLKDLVKYLITFGESANSYAVFLNGGSGGEEPGGDLTLKYYKNSKYTDDMPNAVIIIPANATAEEQFAAELLTTYIKQEDKYTPATYKDNAVSAGSKGFEISVGKTNRQRGTLSYTSDGAYKIKSYSQGVAIFGNGKRGTIDGTMKFLSLCGGYFWLSFEDGYKTNQSHFKYSSSMDIEYERPFYFTDIDVSFGLTQKGNNRMFSLANGLNGFYVNLNVQNKPGAHPKWYLSHAASTKGYGGLQPGQAHTLLAEFVTPEKYFSSHPEYFAYVKQKDGTYKRQDSQLCLSNPNVYPIIRDHVFDILKNGNYDPNAEMQIISLSQADNGAICMCSNCVKFRQDHEPSNKKEGLCEAALFLDLCNKISAEVKAEGYKNVYIDMLAYTRNLKPPVGMSIDDHVIVRFASISRCYAHNVDDTSCEQNKEDIEYLKGWANLCKSGNANLWIWDYNANWLYTTGPYLNIATLSHDIKYYYELGVTGVYLQSNDAHTATNTEFGDLRNYLGGVLLENPYADVDKEIAFFCNEFYGESGQYIIQAMRIMEKQARNHGNVGPNHEAGTSAWYYRDKITGYNTSVSQVFCNYYPTGMDAQNQMPAEDLAKCEELWNKALAAAAGDTERHRYNTNRTHLCWRYVKSNMRVYEFSDPSTYLDKNTELYNDIFSKYGMEFYSLTRRNKPPTTYLNHVPDFWYSENDRGTSY